jgi:hypothetical protein
MTQLNFGWQKQFFLTLQTIFGFKIKEKVNKLITMKPAYTLLLIVFSRPHLSYGDSTVPLCSLFTAPL